MYRKRIQHVHFVGIGGIGMSGIAEVLLNLGYNVSGSDIRDSDNTKRLQELGATIFTTGHNEAHLAAADVVVTSSAIRGSNPEVDAARRRKIPVIRRAEMLAELMRMKYGIAVAGTHGKTTTTSIISAILEHAGVDPTIVIGGRLNSTGNNAKLGQGDFLVAEADESDGSFLKLSPTISVVTNIDPEHLDFFGDMDNVRKSFLDFLNKVPFYGLNTQADIQANAIEYGAGKTSFELIAHGNSLGRLTVNMLGQHNVLNTLAACAVAFELEVPFEEIRDGLAAFDGIQRRFQFWARSEKLMVVDDYAHHPTEIKATLSGAHSAFHSRVIAVFQPHRYSRVRDLFQEFVTSFYQADMLFVTDIHPAGEQPIEGITGEKMAEAISNHGHRHARHVSDRGELLKAIQAEIQPGDLVITLGAGDIWKVARDLSALA
jgi:UDP-N-acetylmuramate--alanine ligase